jgi:hypothetical protein
LTAVAAIARWPRVGRHSKGVDQRLPVALRGGSRERGDGRGFVTTAWTTSIRRAD